MPDIESMLDLESGRHADVVSCPMYTKELKVKKGYSRLTEDRPCFIGDRMDFSVRDVIVPDPTLRVNQIELSYPAALEEQKLWCRKERYYRRYVYGDMKFTKDLDEQIKKKRESTIFTAHRVICERFGFDVDGDEARVGSTYIPINIQTTKNYLLTGRISQF